MTPESILSQPPRVLTQAQREHYFEHGYVGVDNLVDEATLAELIDVTGQFVDASGAEAESGEVFDLGPGHSRQNPALRRLKRPDDQHRAYWDFAAGIIAEVAADLAGPDVVFHHSKLNFKWFDEGDAVAWHQDIQFFPHTNYQVLTIGCYLADTDMTNGPLAVLPGSHNGPLYDLYAPDGVWAGALSDRDAAELDLSRAAYLTGPAGFITAHNCRALHGSPPSRSPQPRPLLLNCYSAADARPYTPHPDASTHAGQVVRGQPARWACHDARPCQIPPDWSGGYTSIFAAQAGEDD